MNNKAENTLFNTLKPVFYFLLAAIAGIGVYLVGTFLTLPLFSLTLSDISILGDLILEEENVGLLRYLQGLSHICIFITPSVLYVLFSHRNPVKHYKLDVNPTFILSFLGMFLIYFSSPIISFTTTINEQINLPSFMAGTEEWMREKENIAAEMINKFFVTDSLSGFIGNLVILAILPAIGEELLFRGLLQNGIQKFSRNPHVAILVTAFVFSAVHLQFYGFIPRFLLGILLGYLYYWSGSLWVPIVTHFANNALIVVLQHFFSQEMLEKVDSFASEPGDWYYVLFSIIAVSGLLYVFYKQAEKRKSIIARS